MPRPQPLTDIPIGASVWIAEIFTPGSNRRRLLDLGLIPGAKVEIIRCSPSGNPTAYLVKGTVIALRNEDAAQILVNKFSTKSEE